MGLSRVPSFSDRPGFPAGLRVLLVEPQASDMQVISSQLQACNYEVSAYNSQAEAEGQLEASLADYDLLMCEVSVVAAEASFAAFLQKIANVPLVLTGENTSQQHKMLGIEVGAVDFLEKPLSILKLRNIWQHTVRKILKQRSSTSTTTLSVDGAQPRPTKSSKSAGSTPSQLTSSAAATARALIQSAAQESTGSSHDEPSALGTPNPCAMSTSQPPPGGKPGRTSSDARTKAKGETLGSSGGNCGLSRRCSDSVHRSMITGQKQSSTVVEAATPSICSAQPPSIDGMMQYSLQGMPAPLPGCVWGLPMLPPPVQGLVGGPMMMPASHMVHPSHPLQPCGVASWPLRSGTCMPTMQAPHVLCPAPPMSHPLGVSAPVVPPPLSSAPSTMDGPAGHAGLDVSKGAPSLTTWSHDASVATNLQNLNWDEMDVFGLGDETDALHQFSDELLQADTEPSNAARGKDVSGGGATEGHDGRVSPGCLLVDELNSNVLSWIDDDYMIDEFKGLGEKSEILDMMA